MEDAEVDLGNGATLALEWLEGSDGRLYADVSLEDGGVILTANFVPPDGLVSLVDWCPGAPNGVIFDWAHHVPSGDDNAHSTRSNGITSFVWQATGAVLSQLMAGWNATHRDAAEARLREHLTTLAASLPAPPGRGVRGAGGEYHAALLDMYAYAALRCDYPLRMLSDVTKLGPSTVRSQLSRARDLAAVARIEGGNFRTRLRH